MNGKKTASAKKQTQRCHAGVSKAVEANNSSFIKKFLSKLDAAKVCTAAILSKNCMTMRQCAHSITIVYLKAFDEE